MCLSNIEIDSKKKKLKKIVAWKVLEYRQDQWVTPYQREPVRENKLKAVGLPKIEDDYDFDNGRFIKQLHGGAIHCYKTRALARDAMSGNSRRAVFQVVGKGYIGENDEDIAFKEIKFLDKVDDWCI